MFVVVYAIGRGAAMGKQFSGFAMALIIVKEAAELRWVVPQRSSGTRYKKSPSA